MGRVLAHRRVRQIFFMMLACCSVLIPRPSRGQSASGAIVGNVVDSSGAAVPNAPITVTNQDTGVVRNTSATADGVYDIPALLPGNYSVEAKVPGFGPVQVKNVAVRVGSETRVDLRLQVGQIAQTLAVIDAVPLVETTGTDVSQVLDDLVIKAIPLNARDIQQLAVVQPGVQYLTTSGYGAKSLTVAGSRPIDNRYLQEGMSIDFAYRVSPVNLASGLMLGVEAVKEFKVLTSNQSAEYGEASGGVVNLLIKSGTNRFHGSAYEFYRNAALDARNFFDAGSSAPPYHRHQFGGALGGPIIKDRTFFFANYEGLREALSRTFIANVPDAAARASATPDIQQIFFNPKAPLYPVCNGPSLGGGLCIFNSNPLEHTQQNYALVKIDHSFGTKNTLSAHYNYDTGWRTTPGKLASTADDRVDRRQTFTIQDTHIFSSYLVNTTRVGVNRFWYNDERFWLFDPTLIDPRLFAYAAKVPCATTCSNPLPGLPSGINTPPPTISAAGGLTDFGGTSQAFNFAPRWIGYTTGQISDDVSYLHGKHAIQVGFEYKRWYDNIDMVRGNPLGQWTFASLNQFLLGQPAQTFGFQNFNKAGGITFGRSWLQSLVGIYGEDTYKVTPNLTLFYGLRWEYVPAPTEKYGRLANLSPNPETATAVSLGDYYNARKTNFSPRIGINWDPTKSGKSSLRAGYSLLYNQISDASYFNSGTAQPPFVAPVSLANLMPFPFNQSVLNTFLAQPQGTLTFANTIEQNPKTPAKYSYNVAFQQQLPDKIVFMIGYVGARQRHSGRQVQYQEYYPSYMIKPGEVPPFGGATTNPQCTQAGQLTCLFWAGTGTTNANVTGVTSGAATDCSATVTRNCFVNNAWGNSISGTVFDGKASYNSLQTTLERRASPGLFIRLNYTYASCWEDSADDLQGGEANGGSQPWTPTRDHSANWHRCSYLGVHAANFTLSYDFPFGGMVQSHWAKALVSDWQLTSLTSVSSGVPFDVREGSNTARAMPAGNGNTHPDWAPGCNADNAINKHNVQNYIKITCFAVPAFGYLGNVEPLALLSPSTWTTDASLKRVISIREGMRIQLTADMFNIFNRTNLAPPALVNVFNPNQSVNTTAGQITSTIGSSRQVQLGARFEF